MTNFPKYARIVRTMEARIIKLPVYSPDLLTIAQAAEDLGVHLATAYRWVEKGKLLAFHIGDQVFVHVDQIEALKDERAAGSERD